MAQEAGVRALAFTHILPQTPLPGLTGTFGREARSAYDGPIWAMRDGDVISLPRTGQACAAPVISVSRADP